MPTFRLGDFFTPHAGQRPPFFSDARVICLKWSRRAGKGRLACFKLIDTYLKLAQSPRDPALVPQFHAMVVSPFRHNADQAWMDLVSFIPKEMMLGEPNHTERKIWLQPTGYIESALIEFRIAENKVGLQGVGLDFLWTTESQDIAQDAYDLFLPLTISANRAGIRLHEGIPPLVPDHWFNMEFDRGMERRKGYFASRLTYLENPMLTAEQVRYIEDLRDTASLAEWERNWLAKDPSALGYAMNIDKCLVAAVDWKKARVIPGRQYVAGLDLGQSVSATVLLVYDRSARPWRLVYMNRMAGGVPWTTQRAALIADIQRWKPAVCIMDATGGGVHLYEDLRQAGLPVRGVQIGANREELLTHLSIILEKQRVAIPNDEVIVREHRAMRPAQTGPLTIRWQVRRGMNDDTVFANALALMDMKLNDGAVNIRKPAERYGVPVGA